MNKPFYFQIAVKEIQAASDNKSVIIQGFASTPDIDRYKDIVEPSAFSSALTMFMKNPSLLRSHNPDCPAGKVLEAKVTDKGLWIRAEVTEEETVDDVIFDRMRALSIGYIPLESVLQHEDGTPFNAEMDSPWDKDMVRVIKRLDLIEISVVSTPANGNALFSIAQSVKSYFNQLVTKSMKLNNEFKNADPAETEEQKTEREAAEKAAADQKAADEKDAADKEIADKLAADEAAAEEARIAAEGAKDKANENGEGEGENGKTKDEAGKAAETAATENAEAGDGEGADAGAEPVVKPEEAKPTADNEVIGVDAETAKSLPELVEVGFIKEAKGAEAITLPKSITSLIAKLTKSYMEKVKEVKELEEKLSSIPEKQALAMQGQFKDTKEAEKKEASQEFKGMFGIK